MVVTGELSRHWWVTGQRLTVHDLIKRRGDRESEEEEMDRLKERWKEMGLGGSQSSALPVL